MRVTVEVAPGELYDKISILDIKMSRICDQNKLSHVVNEHTTLIRSAAELTAKLPQQSRLLLQEHIASLLSINNTIWDVLQKQRDLEHAKDFGQEFISTSLDVYHLNDKRAEYKKKINEIFGSDIAEVKSYTERT